jgi:hypothetical protein
MSCTAVLRGGPFGGAEVAVLEHWPYFVAKGSGVPEGYAARYTATRDPNVLRFRGLTKIVAELPAPALPGRRAP